MTCLRMQIGKERPQNVFFSNLLNVNAYENVESLYGLHLG